MDILRGLIYNIEPILTLIDYALDCGSAQVMRHRADPLIASISWLAIGAIVLSMIVNLILLIRLLRRHSEFFGFCRLQNRPLFAFFSALACTNAQVLTAYVNLILASSTGSLISAKGDLVKGDIRSSAVFSQLVENVPQLLIQGFVAIYQALKQDQISVVQTFSLASSALMLVVSLVTNFVYFQVNSVLVGERCTLTHETIQKLVKRKALDNICAALDTHLMTQAFAQCVTIAIDAYFTYLVFASPSPPPFLKPVCCCLLVLPYFIVFVSCFHFIGSHPESFVHLLLYPYRVLLTVILCCIHAMFAVVLNPLGTEVNELVRRGQVPVLIIPTLVRNISWALLFAYGCWKRDNGFLDQQEVYMMIAGSIHLCVLVFDFCGNLADCILGSSENVYQMVEEQSRLTAHSTGNIDDSEVSRLFHELEGLESRLGESDTKAQQFAIIKKANAIIDQLEQELEKSSHGNDTVNIKNIFSAEYILQKSVFLHVHDIFRRPLADGEVAERTLEKHLCYVPFSAYQEVKQLYVDFDRLVLEGAEIGQFQPLLDRARSQEEILGLDEAILEGVKYRAAYRALETILNSSQTDASRIKEAIEAAKVVATRTDRQLAAIIFRAEVLMARENVGADSGTPSPEASALEERPAHTIDDDRTYTGQWKGDTIEGFGVMQYKSGGLYQGYWRDGKHQGKGKMLHADGDMYEGDFENGEAHGQGTYVHAGGATYEGGWMHDRQHGFGIEIFPDGAKYEGNYENAKKSGKGIFIWADGSKYDGNFENNDIDGYGLYSWPDGREYQGNWKANKMNGKGRFSWADGRCYDGEYVDDEKHGQGSFLWPDGRKYVGGWVNGKQEGLGEYTSASGDVKKGIWKNGKREQWLS